MAIKESPIFVKTFDFTVWLLQHTVKFPKSQRFVMAKRIEDAALNFYDLLILAAKAEGDKKIFLQKASYELERLKYYLRLCMELKLFSISQYEYSSKMLAEIGKLIGGWIKKYSKGMDE